MNMSKEANVYVVWHCESSEYSYICFAKLICDTNHGKGLLCDPFNPQSLHSLENVSVAVHTHLSEVALWVKATCPSIREGIAHIHPPCGGRNQQNSQVSMYSDLCRCHEKGFFCTGTHGIAYFHHWGK